MAIAYEQALNAYRSLNPSADVSSPEGQGAFNNWWSSIEDMTPEVFNAALGVLAKPDQRDAFVRDYGGDMKRWLEATVGWWTDNGHTVANKLGEFAPEMALVDAMGYKTNPAAVAAVGANTPLGTYDPNNPNASAIEPQLFGQVVNNYGNADIAADAGRRDQANAIAVQTNAAIDNALRVNSELTAGSFDAVGYLKANPDVAAWAQKVVSEGQFPDLATAAKAHYDNFGKNEGRQASTITRLQTENQMADDTAARLSDAAQKAAAARLTALDQRKAEMTTALDRMQTDRSGALDSQTAQLREGLAQLETERKAALQELTAARIGAANSQVTGINQGLESERDRITAQAAQQGFIGGSSMQDAALARATIGARQGAAQAMGSAKVANATDSRNLGDDIANTRFGITGNDATSRYGIATDTAKGRFNLDDALSSSRVGVADALAAQQQSATDTGTKMRLGYFDNDFNRRLQSALLPISLETSRFNLIDAGGEVGQAGLHRTMNNLNWFATPTGTPASNVPVNAGGPSQVGADIAGLGAGLAKTGFNIGNSVGWGNLFGKSGTPAGGYSTNPDDIYNSGGLWQGQ